MNSTPAEHSFFRWLRSLDLQRGSDRWIGGVASGLAARTRLDPILVRGIVLIVVLFTGVGLFLYGLAWALLPGPTGRIHVQEVGRGNWTMGFTGALVLLVLGTADWFRPRFWDRDVVDFGGLVFLGLVGLVVWFFVARHRNRSAAQGTTPGGPQAPGRDAPGTAAYAPGAPAFGPAPAPGSAAPFAAATRSGDAPGGSGTTAPQPAPPSSYVPPKPPKPAPAPRPRHARLSGASTAIVLGVALLAGSAVLAADYFSQTRISFWAWTVATAVALTVVGAGLVAAALSKRSGGALTGWAVLLLIPALIVGLFSGALGGSDYRNHGLFWTDSYDSLTDHGEGLYAFSRSRTDLTYMSSIEEDTSVPFNTAFSRTTIIVPADIPVYLDGAAPFMSVEVTSADGMELLEISGVTTPQHHLLTDVTEGPSLTLDVNGAFSRVDIIVDGDGEDMLDSDSSLWDDAEPDDSFEDADRDTEDSPTSAHQHIQPLEPMEAAK
ncbi:PspC domain-containing protein [Zhihengliuella halotolerans]|uniref:PspC domain-containing protein n=1 Tax=Zhihengliuella halotolerans TaxID=370736 RepID=UPI000C7FCD91|nr:PspC domain-containing protein [Zhihengliuella halotolerans]